MSRSGTYAFRDGHLVKVASRIPALRGIERPARDQAAVRESLLKGYGVLERKGELTRKGAQFTNKQLLRALKP